MLVLGRETGLLMPPKFIQISVGGGGYRTSFLALGEDGTVWCWFGTGTDGNWVELKNENGPKA